MNGKPEKMKYRRILLKLSGESLEGEKSGGISPARLKTYAEQIKQAADSGVQIGIVIGGGNIFRGLKGASEGFDRVRGDQMGMLATIINSLALQDALQKAGKSFDFMIYPDGMHGYRGYQGTHFLAENRAFWLHYLKGE